jgi:hypothetical protein
MAKRTTVAIPTSITPDVEAVAKALGMNSNKFAVSCIEGCLLAINADTSPTVPIVLHARRVLRKDSAAADRLFVEMLEKTFPNLPKNTSRFRELLVEEANKIEGQLTQERLKAAHSIAMARWKAEAKP